MVILSLRLLCLRVNLLQACPVTMGQLPTSHPHPQHLLSRLESGETGLDDSVALPVFAFEELSERSESQRGQELTWGSPAGKGGQTSRAGAEDRRPASFRWPVCLSSWPRVEGALSWPITLSRPSLWDMIQASWRLGCESGFLGRESSA